MSEEKGKKTVKARVNLPGDLWLRVKAVAPFLGMTRHELVAEILSEWIDEHVTLHIDEGEYEVEDIVAGGERR